MYQKETEKNSFFSGARKTPQKEPLSLRAIRTALPFLLLEFFTAFLFLLFFFFFFFLGHNKSPVSCRKKKLSLSLCLYFFFYLMPNILVRLCGEIFAGIG